MARCVFQFPFPVGILMLSMVLSNVVSQLPLANAQVGNPPANSPPASTVGTALTGANIQTAGGPTASTGGVEQTAWAGVPLPKLTLPKLTMPKLELPSLDAVTAPVKSGITKVTTGTKKAWEGTKEIFTFGAQEGSTVASSQQKPSLWQRLTTPVAEPQAPQTVGEFMRQPRLDP